jgi:hypothetical protein
LPTPRQHTGSHLYCLTLTHVHFSQTLVPATVRTWSLPLPGSSDSLRPQKGIPRILSVPAPCSAWALCPATSCAQRGGQTSASPWIPGLGPAAGCRDKSRKCPALAPASPLQRAGEGKERLQSLFAVPAGLPARPFLCPGSGPIRSEDMFLARYTRPREPIRHSGLGEEGCRQGWREMWLSAPASWGGS